MHTQALLTVKIVGTIPTEGLTRHLRMASPANWLGRTLVGSAERKVGIRQASTHPDRPRVGRLLNDNYFVKAPLQTGRLTWSKETVNIYQCQQTGPLSGETVKVCQTVKNVVNSVIVNHTHIVFQPTIFGPKTKQQVETHLRPQQSKQVPQGRKN